MNFKEKLAYIWEYYKAVIFGIIAVIFIIGTIVNIHENAKYYDLVSIAVVDYAGLRGCKSDRGGPKRSARNRR